MHGKANTIHNEEPIKSAVWFEEKKKLYYCSYIIKNTTSAHRVWLLDRGLVLFFNNPAMTTKAFKDYIFNKKFALDIWRESNSFFVKSHRKK